MEKLKLDIQMFSVSEETDQYYVRSESHAKHPAYNKDEMDTLLSSKANSSNVYTKNEVYTKTEIDTRLDLKLNSSKITYGTANPSGGENGDIYFQYS